VSAVNSLGITNANVTDSNGALALYCIHDLPFTPRSIVATVEAGGSAQTATAALGGNVSCPAGTQAYVRTVDENGMLDEEDFFVVLN
jgi:hypothetical protein